MMAWSYDILPHATLRSRLAIKLASLRVRVRHTLCYRFGSHSWKLKIGKTGRQYRACYHCGRIANLKEYYSAHGLTYVWEPEE